MARPNSFVLCLSDSTGYGLLPNPKGMGQGAVVDGDMAIMISCGGSLVKKGAGGKSTMQIFWGFLEEGIGLPSDDTPVTCGCIPAKDSVPKRSWELLEAHRSGHNLRETRQSILEMYPDAYNKKGVHFNAGKAADVMRGIIQAAASELLEDQPTGTMAVVICAGWNASTQNEMLPHQLRFIYVVLPFESIHPHFEFFSFSRFMVAQHCHLMFAVLTCPSCFWIYPLQSPFIS